MSYNKEKVKQIYTELCAVYGKYVHDAEITTTVLVDAALTFYCRALVTAIGAIISSGNDKDALPFVNATCHLIQKAINEQTSLNIEVIVRNLKDEGHSH